MVNGKKASTLDQQDDTARIKSSTPYWLEEWYTATNVMPLHGRASARSRCLKFERYLDLEELVSYLSAMTDVLSRRRLHSTCNPSTRHQAEQSKNGQASFETEVRH